MRLEHEVVTLQLCGEGREVALEKLLDEKTSAGWEVFSVSAFTDESVQYALVVVRRAPPLPS